MTSLQREQLRHAILRLLLNQMIGEIADQEMQKTGNIRLTEFLKKQMPIFSKLVADDVQDRRILALALSEPFLASLDTQEVKAEIEDVSKWLSELLDAAIRHRAPW